MFECFVCQKQLKHNNLNTVSSHFRTNKCLKITNDLWLERDLLLQKIQKGDKSTDTLEKHHDADVLYNSYVKFRSDIRQEFYDARLTKWKTVHGLNK